MKTWITICDTCKRDGWAESGMEQTDGERLASLIEAQAPAAGIATRRVSCLMGCDHACNVSIQAPGKISYVLGGFKPEKEDAGGIVSYARLHQESENGQVAFRTWPAEIKGHFIARLPPLAKAP